MKTEEETRRVLEVLKRRIVHLQLNEFKWGEDRAESENQSAIETCLIARNVLEWSLSSGKGYIFQELINPIEAEEAKGERKKEAR